MESQVATKNSVGFNMTRGSRAYLFRLCLVDDLEGLNVRFINGPNLAYNDFKIFSSKSIGTK